jgi:hypothetical protein
MLSSDKADSCRMRNAATVEIGLLLRFIVCHTTAACDERPTLTGRWTPIHESTTTGPIGRSA